MIRNKLQFKIKSPITIIHFFKIDSNYASIYDVKSGKELVLIRLKITGGKPSSKDPNVMRPIRYTLIVDVKPLFKQLARTQ